MAASSLLWLVGELTWSAYELVLHQEPPFPSIADAFYLTSYALVVPAVMVAFESTSLRRLRGALDASIMVVAIGVAGYVLLLAPQLDWGMSWATATGIAYPLLGVLILMTLLAAAFTGRGRAPRSVMLIAAAFAVSALTDALYTYLAVIHEFVNGSWLNVGWQLEACQLEHALHQQERLAVTDALTGVHNRRFFEEVVKLEGERARRNDTPLALLVIDLDHFKRVNDTYGHQGGDAVLTTAARRLAETLRPGDVLARYGGEEFIVILPDTGIEPAVAAAERCRAAIGGAAIPAAARQVAVTVSVGVAVLGEHADTIEELVRAADHALYLAKRLGRNQVRSGGITAGEELGALAGDNHVIDYLQLLADDIDSRQASDAHSLAMARWAGLLASALDLDDAATQRAVAGARLHDIGKVAVPDAILTKPAPLTDDEWQVIREHPAHGARLAALDSLLAEVAQVILDHHERPDGRGYPHGKPNDQISVEAKIIAVCDAWAAMRAHRRYRAPLSLEAARHQLRRGAGSQFDPDVVAAFLALEADGQIGTLAYQLAPVAA